MYSFPVSCYAPQNIIQLLTVRIRSITHYYSVEFSICLLFYNHLCYHPPVCSSIQSIWSWSSSSSCFGVWCPSTRSPSNRNRREPAATPFLCAYVSKTFDILVVRLILKKVSSPVCSLGLWCVRWLQRTYREKEDYIGQCEKEAVDHYQLEWLMVHDRSEGCLQWTN